MNTPNTPYLNEVKQVLLSYAGAGQDSYFSSAIMSFSKGKAHKDSARALLQKITKWQNESVPIEEIHNRVTTEIADLTIMLSNDEETVLLPKLIEIIDKYDNNFGTTLIKRFNQEKLFPLQTQPFEIPEDKTLLVENSDREIDALEKLNKISYKNNEIDNVKTFLQQQTGENSNPLYENLPLFFTQGVGDSPGMLWHAAKSFFKAISYPPGSNEKGSAHYIGRVDLRLEFLQLEKDKVIIAEQYTVNNILDPNADKTFNLRDPVTATHVFEVTFDAEKNALLANTISLVAHHSTEPEKGLSAEVGAGPVLGR